MNCFVNPCAVDLCPNHPNAVCTANYCGGCYAIFTDSDGNVVTGTCTSSPTQAPTTSLTCSNSNRPRIDSISPSSGPPGTVVTLEGDWRSGPTMTARCFWRVGGALSMSGQCFYSIYQPATIVSSSEITCVVPDMVSTVSSCANVPGPGDDALVGVQVFDDAHESGQSNDCFSYYGSDLDENFGGPFVYYASPTNAPTRFPTHVPTRRPTESPSNVPTRSPTRAPTRRPTESPSTCLLYTSPSPRDRTRSRMPSSA